MNAPAAPSLSPGAAALARDVKTLLVVWDDPRQSARLGRALRERGVRHRLVGATDSSQALDYLRGRGAFAGRDPRVAPELVVVDLTRERRRGLDFIAALRGEPRLRFIPVVAVAGGEAELAELEAGDWGPSLFVRRPESGALETLAGRLDTLLS